MLGDLVDRITDRARQAADDDGVADRVRDRLTNRVDLWRKRRNELHQESKTLVYERVRKGAGQGSLMIGAEAAGRKLPGDPPFVVPNSMREVQPEINLLVSPDPKRLFVKPPENAPSWVFPADEED